MEQNVIIIITDRSRCIKCSSCASLAPANFFVDKEGSSIAKQPSSGVEQNACMEALENCPAQIITLGGFKSEVRPYPITKD
jgi:ferredoxin